MSIHALKSCLLEFRKSKRRLTLLLILAVVGINLAYFFGGMSRGDQTDASHTWESIFFYIPLWNSLILSVLMAILASRTMDLEHKGKTWNLLQTMQSRQSLFLGKTMYGFCAVLLFTVLQMVLVAALGKYYGFAGWPPVGAVLLITTGEIAGGMVIYQLQCLLSLLFSNQFAALSGNLCGTLAGFFLMYVTDKPLTPWSLIGALRVLNMEVPDGDLPPVFTWTYAPVSSWLVTALYFMLFLGIGLALYSRMEEGTLSGAELKTVKSGSLHNGFPAELIKLRRSPVWIVFFAIPLISALIGTFNFVENQGALSFSWDSLWTQQSLFLGMFFLSPLIGIVCSLLWRMEHNGTVWNLVLTVESPAKIVRDKLLTVSGLSALCMLWVGVLFVLSGKAAGLSGGIPSALYERLFSGILGCIAIASVQIFLSLVIHSFAVPVGLALAGSLAGLACLIQGWNYALPYALLQFGLGSTDLQRDMNLPMFTAVCAGFTIVFFLMSVLYLQRSDVRTQ